MGKTRRIADYDPDASAPFVARTDVFDPPVVKRHRRASSVLREHLRELPTSGECLSQHFRYHGFVYQRRAVIEQGSARLRRGHRGATLSGAAGSYATHEKAPRLNRRYRLGVILETINGPSDLRRLDYEQLTNLAAEIRDFIVHAVSSANTGHLGSNLGCRRTDAGAAPGIQFAAGLRHLGHGPPGLRAQARYRPA